ncbi:hypothetical protein [Streptomyces sp. NPDC002082]|uniref:PKD domain-containing protein n=1 Tax=Streptomyces sp. NPDC002082 TaxID=3154772 RepID=UPI003328DB63
MAAGVGLMPGAAHADPVAPDTHGVTVPDADLKAASAENFKTFKSSAARSVRKNTAPAGAKATAQAEVGNPDLAVDLAAYNASAHSISLDTTISSVAGAWINVVIEWGDGTTSQESSSGGSKITTTHNYEELGTYAVKVTATDTANNTSADNTVEIRTAGSEFTPYGPTRLLDTRDGTGAPAAAKVRAYSSVRLKIAGNGKIPAGVTAVALNLTVTNTRSSGHVTAFPAGTEKPNTSNVNFAPGQTVPNLAIVPVGEDGYVELYNGGWEAIDLIADATGYFTKSASSGYTPVTPIRFADTRSGLGTGKGQIIGQRGRGIQIGGANGIPAGITAVALNVTVTNPRGDGHLTVYPSGKAVPTASNLNFTAGQTVANSVIVPVGADGRINIRNGAWANTDVIVDVVGYYSPASEGAYLRLKPKRVFDTRDPQDSIYGKMWGRGYIWTDFASKWPDDMGYVLNATVTNPEGPGFLAVAPDPNYRWMYDSNSDSWPAAPTSSTLNFTADKTVANLVQASTGNTGIIDFFNQSDSRIDLVVDMFGYYDRN